METHLDPLLRELMGAELRAERHSQRRTLAEVAAAAGVSMQHLSDVERGRKDPSSELLAAILGALGVDLALFLRRAAGVAVADPLSGPHSARVVELRSSPASAQGASPSSALRPVHAPRGGAALTLLAAA